MTKLTVAVALLFAAHTALGQNEFFVNLTDFEAGNCLCNGRGELRRDHLLNWLPEGYLDGISEGVDLPRISTTCGDIQDLFASDTECPQVAWMSFCCTEEPPFYQCAEQVRSQLLDGYDKLAVPSTSLIHDPVNVQVEMIYHTITGIKEAEGVFEIFVWLNLKWKDPRLSWNYDPSPSGTCTGLPVNFRAEKQQGLKDSEIWVPEFDLYNQISGVNGMTGIVAAVENDGSVTWFRQGKLKAICQMENLGQIPFESLVCQLLMGSRSLGVKYKLDPSGGLKVSNYAGPYNGFRLINAEPGDTGRGDTLFYNLEYGRGTSFYVQNIIIPTIVFTYCSIGTMVVGVGAFQTLALNFTLLLVTVAQKISVASLLPVTNERLWLVDFVFGSFYFIVFTIVLQFFKFMILQMREETQQQDTGEGDAEEGAAEERKSRNSRLPSFFFTFSTRRLDVRCCILSFLIYTIYIIIFFAGRSGWGSGVQFTHLKNGTTIDNPEL